MFVKPCTAGAPPDSGAMWKLADTFEAVASSVCVHFVPAIQAPSAIAENSLEVHPSGAPLASSMWKESVLANGLGTPLSKQLLANMPHGELHKAYLCLSQLQREEGWGQDELGDFDVTPVFDAYAIHQSFARLEVDLAAEDLFKRMQEEFCGYALRRCAPGVTKLKVRCMV